MDSAASEDEPVAEILELCARPAWLALSTQYIKRDLQIPSYMTAHIIECKEIEVN